MVTETMQLPFEGLPTRADFIPVPSGSRHYVPVVQNRRGELDALCQASDAAWSRMTPLIEVVGEKQRRTPYKREAVAQWLRNLGEAVGTRPCFLDLLRLKPDHDTVTSRGTRPILTVIYEEARKRRIAFVPVLLVGANTSAKHVALVRDASLQDGRGVALRYRPMGVALAPGVTVSSLLQQRLGDLHLAVGAADLVVDLEYLDPDREVDVSYLSDLFAEVAALGDWRSLIVVGSSMPSSLGGIVPEGTIGEITRREWAIWQALKTVVRDRVPTFGDYLVQHPTPPHEAGGPGMRANIRYTTGPATLVARAQGPVIVVGREQYRELCQQLVVHPAFAGEGFSWGDRRIADCANGRFPPGWQSVWRGAGSSHHIAVVTRDICR